MIEDEINCRDSLVNFIIKFTNAVDVHVTIWERLSYLRDSIIHPLNYPRKYAFQPFEGHLDTNEVVAKMQWVPVFLKINFLSRIVPHENVEIFHG